MKQIPVELLDELIDIALELLGAKIVLEGTSTRNDAVIADLARTIADARKVLCGDHRDEKRIKTKEG